MVVDEDMEYWTWPDNLDFAKFDDPPATSIKDLTHNAEWEAEVAKDHTVIRKIINMIESSPMALLRPDKHNCIIALEVCQATDHLMSVHTEYTMIESIWVLLTIRHQY